MYKHARITLATLAIATTLALTGCNGETPTDEERALHGWNSITSTQQDAICTIYNNAPTAAEAMMRGTDGFDDDLADAMMTTVLPVAC
jgi:uncharacterized protein YgiB involved in biofilm formation